MGSAVDLTSVSEISCNWYSCVAVKTDGTAVAWGHATYGGDASSVDLTSIAGATCGPYQCIAWKNDGSVVQWGYTRGSVPAITNVIEARCWRYQCMARSSDGTAVIWGVNNFGGTPSGVHLTNVAHISCGYGCVVLKNDRTAEALGHYYDASNVGLTNLRECTNSAAGRRHLEAMDFPSLTLEEDPEREMFDELYSFQDGGRRLLGETMDYPSLTP